MAKIPVENSDDKPSGKMTICIPYDINNIYAFFCSRYGVQKYDDLINMGYEEFIAKINSIPKDEPLYDIIKSRVIDVSKIKDKEERKYWQDLKQINAIPDIYMSIEDINKDIINKVKGNNGGILNGKRIK